MMIENETYDISGLALAATAGKDYRLQRPDPLRRQLWFCIQGHRKAGGGLGAQRK